MTKLFLIVFASGVGAAAMAHAIPAWCDAACVEEINTMVDTKPYKPCKTIPHEEGTFYMTRCVQ